MGKAGIEELKMKTILVFLILSLIWGSKVRAAEIGFDKASTQSGIRVDWNDIKQKGTSNRYSTTRVWSNIQLSWAIEEVSALQEGLSWTKIGELKLVDDMVIEAGFPDRKSGITERNLYGSIRLKETYFAIGKQPILWGVAKGKNPTRYFMQRSAFDKQREPEIPLVGVEAAVIGFPIKAVSFETVFSKEPVLGASDDFKNATRFKGVVWDTDLSVSFLAAKGENKIGGEFNRAIRGGLGLYGEVAAGNIKEEYQWIGGISQVIYSFARSSIYLENERSHIKGKRENNLLLGLSLSPMEPVSLLTLVSYDYNTKAIFSMMRMRYSIRVGEVVLLGTVRSYGKEDKMQSEYAIQPQFIYYF